MKILVTAPTGSIGRIVISELLAPEFSVRVIAREAPLLPERVREQVEFIRGSMEDFETLRGALENVEALFWSVPRESQHESNVRDYYQRVALTGCRAIRKARTPRVVSISAIGNVIGLKAGAVSTFRAMEEILNRSGAAIRHLRCGWLMENFRRQAQSICNQGVFAYPMPGHIPVPMVAAKDVADLALRRLVRRDWEGVDSVPVSGPESLSFNQAAAVMEQVLARPVRYVELSPDHHIQSFVQSGARLQPGGRVANLFADLAHNSVRPSIQMDEPPPPTTLADWTKSELLPIIEKLGSRCQSRPSGLDMDKTEPQNPILPQIP